MRGSPDFTLLLPILKLSQHFRAEDPKLLDFTADYMRENSRKLSVHDNLQVMNFLAYFQAIPYEQFYADLPVWVQFSISDENLAARHGRNILLLAQVLARARGHYLVTSQAKVLQTLTSRLGSFFAYELVKALYLASLFQVGVRPFAEDLLPRLESEAQNLSAVSSRLLLLALCNLQRRDELPSVGAGLLSGLHPEDEFYERVAAHLAK